MKGDAWEELDRAVNGDAKEPPRMESKASHRNCLDACSKGAAPHRQARRWNSSELKGKATEKSGLETRREGKDKNC